MVTIYCSEKIQAKMSQWERRMGECPGKFYMWNFQLSSLHEVMDEVKFPSDMCDDVYGLLPTSQIYQKLGFQFFGAWFPKCSWPPTWPTSVTSHHPKSHCSCLTAQRPQGNKDRLIRHSIPTS